jgi:hypothetical protein
MRCWRLQVTPAVGVVAPAPQGQLDIAPIEQSTGEFESVAARSNWFDGDRAGVQRDAKGRPANLR